MGETGWKKNYIKKSHPKKKKKTGIWLPGKHLKGHYRPHEQTKDAASDPVAAVFQRLIIQGVSHGHDGSYRVWAPKQL